MVPVFPQTAEDRVLEEKDLADCCGCGIFEDISRNKEMKSMKGVGILF